MSRSAPVTLSSTMFEDRFPSYVLTFVSEFNVILKKKTVFFKFLWLEFRFKSFLELYVHLNGFMCICMRKLHAESQIQTDAHCWCQIVFSLNVPKFIPKYWTKKHYRNIWGDRLELWPSIYLINLVWFITYIYTQWPVILNTHLMNFIE